MKNLIMRFRIENAIRLFNIGIFDKTAMSYEIGLAVDWFTKKEIK